MTNPKFQEWIADFNKFLEKNNKDLIGLYHERILFLPNEHNDVKPKLLPLKEPYATQEQITRMNEVFNDYLNNHPL